MEFVQITKDGIDSVATVPVTALPHWEGYGWRTLDTQDAQPEPVPETLPTVQPRVLRRTSATPESTTEE